MVRTRVTSADWVCTKCGGLPPEATPYAQTIKGVVYLRPVCRQCDNAGRSRYKRQPNSPAVDARWNLLRREARRAPSPLSRAKHIIADSARADRRKGRETCLLEDFVVSMITQPCCYCGDTRSQMTLDRIDNTIGHVPDNVVPACVRCNITRGGMPYAAWKIVSQGMQQARELGLFGEWDGRTLGNTKLPALNLG